MIFNDALLGLCTASDHEWYGKQVICFPVMILAYAHMVPNLRSSYSNHSRHLLRVRHPIGKGESSILENKSLCSHGNSFRHIYHPQSIQLIARNTYLYWRWGKSICSEDSRVPGISALYLCTLSPSIIFKKWFQWFLRISHLISLVRGESNWIFNPWLIMLHMACWVQVGPGKCFPPTYYCQARLHVTRICRKIKQ